MQGVLYGVPVLAATLQQCARQECGENIMPPHLAGFVLQAPEYMLERDPNADEHGSTCLLRFTAGPPYEDVYFKILNKEWGARPPLACPAGGQPPALHGYMSAWCAACSL